VQVRFGERLGKTGGPKPHGVPNLLLPYIPTGEGWLYLAGHKDLFTGEVVGYAMAERMTKNLVSQSLLKAIAAKRPAAGLIHHSARGSQYCAREYA
jgi:putative transposase